MTLSIVILQTNKPKDAENCLAALSKAELPAETEVIVINNGGHIANDTIDPSSYATLHNVRFFDLPPGGYIEGNNYGYHFSSGDYIATLNADITVQEDTIEKLLEYLKKNPDTGIAAPRLFYPDGHEQDSARPFPNIAGLLWRRIIRPNVHRAAIVRFNDKDAIDVDWFVGAMFLMTRRCLDTTKGHDPRYFLFMSDVTLCRDTWSEGMRVVQLKDSKATHNESRLSQGSLLQMLRKRTGRAHLKDACAYFLHFLFKPYPRLSPSGRS